MAETVLSFSSPWQMLVATILSAQCTDERVNMITKELFKIYPDVSDYIDMNAAELIKYVKSAGFYKNKTKSILGSAKMIQENFKTPERDLTKPSKMFIVRSFDVNKPGTEIKNLKGGVLGGALVQGELKINDEIELRPGIFNTSDCVNRFSSLPGKRYS